MKRYFRRTFVIVLLAMLGNLTAIADMNARIPAGTSVQVRITENLSSETARVGQVFHGSLDAPVIANNKKLFPRGAYVTGEVVTVERSGRLSTPGELHLTLRTIRNGGRTYDVSVGTLVLKGESHTKSNVTKIGGGAALGAMIGAIAGGGKGAGIGAGVGAAAGTGVAAGTGKKPAEVRSETLLEWVAQDGRAIEASQEQAPGLTINEHEAPPVEHYADRAHYEDDDLRAYYAPQAPSGFSDQERQVISACLVNDRDALPPGLAKKNRLPPGLERQLQRNETLPPGLQKRVQSLPGSCENRLPGLPRDWARVVLSGRILLLDPQQRIVDLFWLERN